MSLSGLRSARASVQESGFDKVSLVRLTVFYRAGKLSAYDDRICPLYGLARSWNGCDCHGVLVSRMLF